MPRRRLQVRPLGRHAVNWLKLVHPILIAGSVAWLYAKNGWRAGYLLPDTGDAIIEHKGRPLCVREQRTRIGWPVWAVVEIPSTRRWRFHLRPQPRLRLKREIETGMPGFDAAFWIDPDSDMLVRALHEGEGLAGHLASLQPLLEREGSALSRIVAENGTLCVELNVRWIRDRPRLYRRMLDWLVELDRRLSADGRAAREGVRPRVRTPACSAPSKPSDRPP